MRRGSCLLPFALAGVLLLGCDGEAVPVTLRPMASVAVGEDHSCGLAESGNAYCWGDGASGQLGNGSTDSERFAQMVARDNQYLTIVAGGHHTCALDADSVAYCWGSNAFGQLGISGAEKVLEPRAVETDVRFVALSAGWFHTCGIGPDGTAYCWGRGLNGELGNGAFPDEVAAPTAVATDLRFRVISAGGRHTCGITTEGEAWCWGANELAQLGTGAEGPPQAIPVQVDLRRDFVDIAAGYNHSCMVAFDGTAYCWGENGHAELGNATVDQPGMPGARRPAEVVSFGNEVYVKISAGQHYSCGLLNQGQLMCWGLNTSGQLGNTGTTFHTVRQLVHTEPGVRLRWDRGPYATFDAGGSTHACAVTTDGTALCWGHGPSGQLGSGDWFSMIPLPVR